MPHFGGDRELGWDWLMAMRDGKPTRSSMADGIQSALTCLWAKRAAEERQIFDVTMSRRD